MEEYLKNVDFEIDEKEKKGDETLYSVSIRIPMDMGWIDQAKFFVESENERKVYLMNHVENRDGYAYFQVDVSLPVHALYHYYFSLEVNHQFFYFKKNHLEDFSTISQDDMWKMSSGFSVPDWAKGKMMYHIFLDRFYRGSEEELSPMKNRVIHSSWDEEPIIGPDGNKRWNTDFYGGDLKGIEEKLDYIKSLGVSIIYVSPIVASQSNHRYDTADYEMVDPYAGRLEDLKSLCDAAHKKGMKVIIDAVFNHTGNDSKYFNQYGSFDNVGAYQSRDSIYFPFYRTYQNNGEVCFDYWWGMKNLPVCDGYSKEWQEYIYGEDGVIDLWFSCGIDGLRLDVADELTDEFIEGIRKAVKRNKEDGFILGEVWKNPMRMNRGYLSSGKGMDSVMNYPLVDALIRYFKYEDKEKLKEVFRQLKTEYPEDTLHSLMNFTSTHDISRAINIFGTKEFQYTGEWAWDPSNRYLNYQKKFTMSEEEYKRGKEIYETYLFTLTFLPGILSVFYGDEVGVEGLGNLANRKPFPWNDMDLELLEFVKWMGRIRKRESFLEKADFRLVDLTDQYFYFERMGQDQLAQVFINRSSNKIPLDIQRDFYYLETYSLGDSNLEELDSHGALVLKKNNRWYRNF